MEVLEFESVKLFEEIIKAGQIKNLISVSSHEYPIYKFKKSNKVTSVYEKFLAEHDMKCDRSVDDCWNDFDDYINQPKKETNDIAKSIPRDEYNELEHACDEAIDYRKHSYNGYSDEISELLQVVRELVLKPDRLDEFMESVTNAVNSFANIDAIDKETLDKLVNVLPVIEKATINAGSIDVNGIVKSMVKDREEKENNVVSIDDRKEE